MRSEIRMSLTFISCHMASAKIRKEIDNSTVPADLQRFLLLHFCRDVLMLLIVFKFLHTLLFHCINFKLIFFSVVTKVTLYVVSPLRCHESGFIICLEIQSFVLLNVTTIKYMPSSPHCHGVRTYPGPPANQAPSLCCVPHVILLAGASEAWLSAREPYSVSGSPHSGLSHTHDRAHCHRQGSGCG